MALQLVQETETQFEETQFDQHQPFLVRVTISPQ